MFKASDVKELREKTGAGMMDCKKALEACDGDQAKAVDWLREKGISKAAKKESRIAAEGLTIAEVDKNKAIIFEVNCETDFVTKSDKFQELIDELTKALMKDKCKDIDSAKEVKLNDGKTIAERIVEATATIGEKISFRRFERISKKKDEVFGIYSHMGGRITSVVVIDGANEEVAKDVAMQVCAMSPVAVNRDGVSKEMVEHEKEVIKAEIKNDEKNKSKPEDIIEKMSVGRLNKFYKEICLEEQDFIKDSGMTVKKYVESQNGTIKSMVRFAVGEGIEKRQENFAEEVAAQMNM